MKVAVVGSRTLFIDDLSKYIPPETTEIVSGGAYGVDYVASLYAKENNLKLKEFFPNYNRYKRGAPLKRNLEIIEYADMVVAIWDGKSRGTKHVIDTCEKIGKPIKVYVENAHEIYLKFRETLSQEQILNYAEMGALLSMREGKIHHNMDTEELNDRLIEVALKELKYEKERRSRVIKKNK